MKIDQYLKSILVKKIQNKSEIKHECYYNVLPERVIEIHLDAENISMNYICFEKAVALSNVTELNSSTKQEYEAKLKEFMELCK